MSDITKLTLIDTIEGLKAKNFSEKELNSAFLGRIKKLNSNLNAYLFVNENSDGIPAAIKDLIVTKGIKTTAGSKVLEDFVPPYNATVIDRLTENGVSVLGKTNCDEFALGSSGENSAYGFTANPWNLRKVPGGTSSGSAAAVAADLCTFALGSDTGGSIRQPAALCGVVGLKPSYGRVSRYGLIAAVSSFDTIGPITKSVADARQVLEWISGEDGYDANCVHLRGVDVQKNTPHLGGENGLKGLKVGIPGEYFEEGLDRQVESVIKTAIKKLEELGAEIVEISLPHTKYAISAYYVINSSEVSSNLARFDGIRYGGTRDKFGNEVKRRIMLGTFSLSSGYYDEYFTKAAKVRTLIKQDFEKAYENCDVIIGPVSPTTAWNLGEKLADTLAMYLSDVYTIPASLAGIPGLSVPCGFVPTSSSGLRGTGAGLPVGLQILGKYMDEATILDVGQVYEENTEWHTKEPVLSI